MGVVASMRLGSGDSRVGYENTITLESSLFLTMLPRVQPEEKFILIVLQQKVT